MSADLLRKAATILREQAEKATPGPWHYKNTEVLGDGTPFGDVLDPDQERVGDSEDEGGAFIAFDGVYVATMHPGVGLALAEVFEKWAFVASLDPDLLHRVGGQETVALARLIVGESA